MRSWEFRSRSRRARTHDWGSVCKEILGAAGVPGPGDAKARGSCSHPRCGARASHLTLLPHGRRFGQQRPHAGCPAGAWDSWTLVRLGFNLIKKKHTDKGSTLHCPSVDGPTGHEVVSSLSPRAFSQSPPNRLDSCGRAETRQNSLPSVPQIPRPFSVHLISAARGTMVAGI